MKLLQKLFLKSRNPRWYRSKHIGIKYRSFWAILFLLLCFGASYGQTPIKVSGIVTNEEGEPLPSASVKLKDATTYAITDVNGGFKITMPSVKGTLVVSYVGYTTKEVLITGTVVNIKLQALTNDLNAVVVIGYGTTTRGNLTTSSSAIAEKNIRNFAVTNVSQLLQGQVAGVYVQSNSGQPGDDASVRIRGLGTVNDNNPLYVVDGQFLESLNNINPNDIEKLEVLKDAAATAIYGSRGSNGVILITTKMAKKGESVTSFDSYVGFKQSVNVPKVQNADQYYDFIITATNNAGPGNTVDPRFTQQYLRGYSTDWWDATNRTPINQNYNLNIRNGGEKTKTYASLGFNNDLGAMKVSSFKRISLKLNSEYDLSKRITAGINVSLVSLTSRGTQGLPAFNYLFQADPFTPIINPDLDPNTPDYEYNKWGVSEWSSQTNPLMLLSLPDKETRNLNALGNTYVNVKLLKGLTYRGQFNYNIENYFYNSFDPIFHASSDPYNVARTTTRFRDASELRTNRNTNENTIIEHRLNYVTKIGKKHNFDITGVMTYELNKAMSVNANKNATPGNGEEYQVLDAATIGATASGGKSENATLSYLGRFSYNYSDRYLLQATYRADGSSRFAEGNKWGYYPSVALAWRLTNEPFFKNLGLSKIISNFKPRISWGQVGNQRISNNAAVTTLATTAATQYYFGTALAPAYLQTNIGNPNIKWEVSEQTNIGFDASFFRDHLSLTGEYYIKKTLGMLLRIPLPAITGYPSTPYSNAGDLQNKGFELTINYANSIGNLNYSIGGNVGTYKTKVTSLGNNGLPLFGTVSKTEIGGPIGRFFVLKKIGVFQNQSEIDNYVNSQGVKIQPLSKPGEFKYENINDDAIINGNDYQYVGDPNPKMIFGFRFSLNYRAFDFSASFQGTFGNQIYNQLKRYGLPTDVTNNLADAYTKAWRKEGDSGEWPLINNNRNGQSYTPSTWWIEDGSYLRLQNVQLGYVIPESFLRRIKAFKTFRIYVSGQNIFTITKYSGIDPEIGQTNVLNLGYDPVRYPSSRTLTIGVNAQF